MGKNVGVMVAE